MSKNSKRNSLTHGTFNTVSQDYVDLDGQYTKNPCHLFEITNAVDNGPTFGQLKQMNIIKTRLDHCNDPLSIIESQPIILRKWTREESSNKVDLYFLFDQGIPNALILFSTNRGVDYYISLLKAIFIPQDTLFKAKLDYTSDEPSHLKVSKNDYIFVYEHLSGGFVRGLNKLTNKQGILPTSILEPKFPIKVYLVNISKNDELDNNGAAVIHYILTAFPEHLYCYFLETFPSTNDLNFILKELRPGDFLECFYNGDQDYSDLCNQTLQPFYEKPKDL
jgi:hypothetical protein